MNFKTLVSTVFMLTTLHCFSQDISLSTLLIDKSLKDNANAIIRNDETIVELFDYDNMSVKSKRIITILNKNGLPHLQAYIQYDPDIKVKSISAKVYNNMGSEIKKFRKKDFDDYSNTGSSLFSDNRVLDLDYTPTEYPFTFEFEYETQTSSTAFIPRWVPLQGYFISTQNSSFTLVNHKNVSIDVEEFNFKDANIENKSHDNITNYVAKNLKAYKWEYMSPAFNKVMPVVMVAPKRFRLIDVDGHAENWEDFGKWNYDNLLTGRSDLPESTKNEVAKLVQGIADPMEKAKVIYNYMQNKTRYISIQLGVGGWQPMLASQVDEVSYGDCKALTNYTKALMESQGIKAYYTVVNGGNDVEDIEKDFVGMQGNHVMLNLPNDGDPVWLECTSQKVPFGLIANFTDDRDVWVITPEGGRIEHTKVYTSKENYLHTTAEVNFNEHGGMAAEISSKSGGTQYDTRLSYIVDSDQKDRDKHYKNYWDYINGLSLDKVSIQNDRDNIEIQETIKVSAPNYAVTAGEKLLVNPNMFNRYTNVPPRYSDRKLPFVIERGFYDADEYTINLPEGYKIETSMQPQEITSKFGNYKASLEILSDTQVKYKRSFEIKKGNYAKDDYKTYRSFIRKVTKADKTSVVLNK
jgi:transglutaminase-like putative cysteine protease